MTADSSTYIMIDRDGIGGINQSQVPCDREKKSSLAIWSGTEIMEDRETNTG